MSRSVWKRSFIDSYIYSNNFIVKSNFRIWSRRSTIPHFLLGKIAFIYNGKIFKKIVITREKIGYKFGDFSFTRNLSNKQIKKKKH